MSQTYQFHYDLAPIAPTQDGQQPEQKNPQQDGAGSKQFTDAVKAFNQKKYNALINSSVGDEEYYNKTREEEKEFVKALKNMLEKDNSLSVSQKNEIGAFMKHNDFNDSLSQISQNYHNNKNDPEAQKKYEEMQKELKDYRVLVENSSQYKDNQHVKNIKTLSEKLDGNATPDKEKAEIKGKLAHEYREFSKEMAQDKDSRAKFESFVEENKDNAIIQKSGMYDMVMEDKKKREAGKDKSRKEELGSTAVTPDGAAKAGSATGKNMDTAGRAVAAANDNVKSKQPERFEVSEHKGDREVTPTQVSGTAVDSGKAAAHR
jgi:hypothetical protein